LKIKYRCEQQVTKKSRRTVTFDPLCWNKRTVSKAGIPIAIGALQQFYLFHHYSHHILFSKVLFALFIYFKGAHELKVRELLRRFTRPELALRRRSVTTRRFFEANARRIAEKLSFNSFNYRP
jgi:hypothetical protein